jgi:hypothetical protein
MSEVKERVAALRAKASRRSLVSCEQQKRSMWH